MGHIVFSHGKDSGPWGGKIRHLASVALKLGFTFDTVDYQGMQDPDARADKLLQFLQNCSACQSKPLYLVGSSMGAYVSLAASQHISVRGLFLLAPALGLPEYRQPMIAPNAGLVEVVHGWHDHLIPPQTVSQWACQHGCTLHLVNDGHRLLKVLPEAGRWFYQWLQQPVIDYSNTASEALTTEIHEPSTT